MQDRHSDLPTFLRYHESGAFRVTSDNVGPEAQEEVLDNKTLVLCCKLDDTFTAYFLGNAQSKEAFVDPGVKALTALMLQLSLYAK
jgi:hypothetical protein